MTDDNAVRYSGDPAGVSRAGVSRRTIIAAGAWSVPAIVLATAAPAAAVSPVKKLNFTNFTLWYDWDGSGNRTGVAGNTTVWLSGTPGATVSLVTLLISVTAEDMSENATVDPSSTGWAFSGASPDGAVMNYSFTWTGGTLIAGASAYTSMLIFRLQALRPLTAVAGGRTWVALAHADGATDANAAGGLGALNPTAAVENLTITDPGTITLTLDPLALHWSGAVLVYDDVVATAHVPYSVRLYRDGSLVATLVGSAIDVDDGQPTSIPAATYAGPEPGVYYVELVVIGTDGVKTAASDTFSVE